MELKNYSADGPEWCLTVKELKQLILNWPEEYPNGDSTFIWVNCEKNKDTYSGKCTFLTKLNVVVDSNGDEIAGICFSTNGYN